VNILNLEKIFEKSSNVIAVNPPIEDFTAYNLWAAPLGLFRVIGSLLEMGKSVEYFDFLDSPLLDEKNAEPPKFRKDGRHSYWRRETEKPDALMFAKRKYFRFGASYETIREQFKRSSKPDILLISSGMTYWYETVLSTARIAKEVWGDDLTIVTGGIAARLMPEVFEREGVHVVRDRFFFHGNYSSFYGYLKDLSFFPANLIEGCPFRCTYCSSRFFYDKVVFRSLDDQAENLKKWHDETGRKDVSFYDDALLLKNGSILEKFLMKLDQDRYSFRFHTPNGLHLKEIDEHLAVLLKKSNFPQLRFGFETIKKGYDNKSSVKELFEKMEVLRGAGFKKSELGVYLLSAMPGQTVSEVEDTIDIVVEAGGRPYLSEFSPVPSTPLFDIHLKESSLNFKEEPLYQNNTLSGYRSPVFNLKVMEKLREKLSQIYREQDRQK